MQPVFYADIRPLDDGWTLDTNAHGNEEAFVFDSWKELVAWLSTLQAGEGE